MTSVVLQPIKTGDVTTSIISDQQRSQDTAIRAGDSIRQFFIAHGMKLLVALVVVSIAYVVMMSFAQMAESDALLANAGMLKTAIVSANQFRHNKCKRRGGCGKNCPFINDQDPRVVICKHSDEIAFVLSETVRSNEELKSQINSQRQFVTDPIVNTMVDSLMANQDDAVRSIKEINACIAELDAAAAKWEKLDVIAINAKERAVALLAAANSQSYKLTAAGLNALGLLFQCRIKDLSGKPQTAKLSRYDEDAAFASTQISVLTTQQQQILSRLSLANYKNAVSTLTTEAVDSGMITAAMATVLNTNQELVPMVKDLVISFSRITEYFNSTVATLEDGFNNKNPGDELSTDSQTAMISTGDYNSVMIQTALGKDLVKNHAKFSSQRSSFDSGGGVPSLRDDDNDLVPWAGFRRPQYFKKNGESMDTSAEPLKQIPSDVPSDMARLSFYEFLAPASK